MGQALRGQGRRPDTSKLLAILAWEGHCASLGSSLETRFSSSDGLEPVTCILLRLNTRPLLSVPEEVYYVDLEDDIVLSPQLKTRKPNALLISLTVTAVLRQ